MTQGCAMFLTKGHISKVMVIMHIYPKSVSRPLLLTVMLDLDNKYITQLLYMTQGCVMTMTYGHTSKVKVTVITYRTSVSGPHLFTLLPYLIWIIFHTTVVHDLRMCHDLDPRSRSQWSHIQNLCPGHNSSLPCCFWIMFHTIVVHNSRMCHDLDLRSYLNGQGQSAHISKICVWAITPHYPVGSW